MQRSTVPHQAAQREQMMKHNSAKRERKKNFIHNAMDWHSAASSCSSSSSSSSSSVSEAMTLQKDESQRLTTRHVVERLKSKHTAEQEKVVLALRFYQSPELVLPNKASFLLQWALSLMTHSEKRHRTSSSSVVEQVQSAKKGEGEQSEESPAFVAAAYWELCHSILSSQPATSLLSLPTNDLLRLLSSAFFFLCSAPSSGGDERASAEVLLEVFTLLFEKFSFCFRPTLEGYAPFLLQLLRGLLLLLKDDNKQNGEEEEAEEEKEKNQKFRSSIKLACSALTTFLEISRPASNHKKVFTLVVDKLLPELLALHLSLSPPSLQSEAKIKNQQQENQREEEKESGDRKEELKRLLDDVLIQTLFPAAHINDYALAFTWNKKENEGNPSLQKQPQGKKNKKAKGGVYYGSLISNYFKLLFDRLRSLLNDVCGSNENYDVNRKANTKKQKHNQEEAERRTQVVNTFPVDKSIALNGLSLLLRLFLRVLVARNAQEAQKRKGGSASTSLPADATDHNSGDEEDDKHIGFHFFQELYSLVASFFSDANKKQTKKGERIATAVRASTLLLVALQEFNVYKATQDTEDKQQLSFLSGMASTDVNLLSRALEPFSATGTYELTGNDSTASLIDDVASLYENLSHLLQLEHLSVEPHLQRLFSVLCKVPWFQQLHKTKLPPPFLPKECLDFAMTASTTYGKLRQFDKFLDNLFAAIADAQQQTYSTTSHKGDGYNAEEDHSIFSSAPFMHCFCTSITQLPVASVPFLWQLFMEHLSIGHVEVLMEDVQQQNPQQQKKQRKKNNGKGEDAITGHLKRKAHALSQASTVFVAFVRSVYLVDSNSYALFTLVDKAFVSILAPLFKYCLAELLPVSARTTLEGKNSNGKKRKREAANEGDSTSSVTPISARMDYRQANGNILCSAFNMYNALMNLRQRCLQFPTAKNKAAIALALSPGSGPPSLFTILRQPEQSFASLTLFDVLQYLDHSYIPHSICLRFVMDNVSVHRLRLLHAAFALHAIQSASKHALEEPDSSPLRKEIDVIVARLFDELRTMLGCDYAVAQKKLLVSEEWDGQLPSITPNNYPTALWTLVTENISIIASFATRKDLLYLMHLLLLTGHPSAFSQKQKDAPEKNAKQTFVVITAINKETLHRVDFSEIVAIRDISMSVVVHGIVGLWQRLQQLLILPHQHQQHLSALSEQLIRIASVETANGYNEEDKSLLLNILATAEKRTRKSTKNKAFSNSNTNCQSPHLHTLVDELECGIHSALDMFPTFWQYFQPVQKLACSAAVLLVHYIWSHCMFSYIHNNRKQENDSETLLWEASRNLDWTCRRIIATLSPISGNKDDAEQSYALLWLDMIGTEGINWLLRSSATTRFESCWEEKDYHADIDNGSTSLVAAAHCSLTQTLRILSSYSSASINHNRIDNLVSIADQLLATISAHSSVSSLYVPFNSIAAILQAILEHVENSNMNNAIESSPLFDIIQRTERSVVPLISQTLLHFNKTQTDTMHQNNFRLLLLLAEQLLRLKLLLSSSDATTNDENTVFSLCAGLLSSSAQILLSSSDSTSTSPSTSSVALKMQAVSFLQFICQQLNQPSMKAELLLASQLQQNNKAAPRDRQFSALLALLHHLLCLYSSQHNQLYEGVKESYKYLLSGATDPQLRQMAHFLRKEFESSNIAVNGWDSATTKAINAVYCAEIVFTLPKGRRVHRHFQHCLPSIMTHLLNVVQRVVLQQSSDKFNRNEELVLVTAVNVISSILRNKSLDVNSKIVSLALQATAPFMSRPLSNTLHKRKVEEEEEEELFTEDEITLTASPKRHQSTRWQWTNISPPPFSIFLAFYHLLRSCLSLRTTETIQCMPSFLSNIRYMMALIFRYAESDPERTDHVENMARLLEELAKHSKAFNKYTGFLLSHYIELVENYALPSIVKQALMPGIYSLLDVCGEFELKQVHIVQSLTGKAIFKKLYEEYSKEWKFSGKV
ncbi:rRNA primary transcript metabolism protein [Balamuthia mandrillaris]